MNAEPRTPSETHTEHSTTHKKIDDQSDDGDESNQDETAGFGDENERQEENAVEEKADYSLFTNPPSLGEMRQRLFDVRDEINMTSSDFELYFPWMDNVWRKERTSTKINEETTVIYCCRLKGKSRQVTPKVALEGKPQRRKRKREERTCGMSIKVVHTESPVKTVRVFRTTSSEFHTHDLDYMDADKRNSAVMDVARREAIRGFLPASVLWKMQQEEDKLVAAGGRFLKVSDVRNGQYQWRQTNPDVTLKAHAGYNQSRSGMRGRPSLTAASLMRSSSLETPTEPKPSAIQKAPHRPIAHKQSMHPPRLPPDTLSYPEQARGFLYNYLPNLEHVARYQRPHVTLTWASSLDSKIASAPGRQTAISGPETKAMTHFLRSKHDAILIGVGTAIVDNPGLNCRLEGAGGYGGPDEVLQPRPIIVDPRGRLIISPTMRLLKAVHEGKARGPWVVVGPAVKLETATVQLLKSYGGEFLQLNDIHPETGFDWNSLFTVLYREGIRSVMIEGGARVLSQLLQPRYSHIVDSVIVTIAPTFIGKGGVDVAPGATFEHNEPIQHRLFDIRWQPMGESDVVLCGHTAKLRQPPPVVSRIQGFARHPPVRGDMALNGSAAAAAAAAPPPLPPPPPPPPAAQSAPKMLLPPVSSQLPPPPPPQPQSQLPPPPALPPPPHATQGNGQGKFSVKRTNTKMTS